MYFEFVKHLLSFIINNSIVNQIMDHEEAEEDYMSDKFLTGLQDVRPSLIHNRAKKRQLDMATKHDENNKKQKDTIKQKSQLDNDSLQAALSKPLSQENKGFKLLAKMGYKPGQALGKTAMSEDNPASSLNETRLVEPIGITIKSDRQGLGREAALRELKERRQKIRQQRLTKELGGETSIEDFRRRANQKHEEKFILNALKRCQVTCENLDIKNNVTQPELAWFWPERLQETSEEDDTNVSENEDDKDDLMEELEFSCQEKLEMLTNYVRTSYLFCYWCGVQYNDEKDMADNCPGLTKDDH